MPFPRTEWRPTGRTMFTGGSAGATPSISITVDNNVPTGGGGAVIRDGYNAMIAGIFIVGLLILGGAILAFNGAFTSERGWEALQAVGVAKANARTGVPSDMNGGGITSVGIANANARAGAPSNADGGVNENVGVARANSHARFGSNSGTSGVNAVKPDIVLPAVAPPSRVYEPRATYTPSTGPAVAHVCSYADSLRSTGAPRGPWSRPEWNPRRRCCDWART